MRPSLQFSIYCSTRLPVSLPLGIPPPPPTYAWSCAQCPGSSARSWLEIRGKEEAGLQSTGPKRESWNVGDRRQPGEKLWKQKKRTWITAWASSRGWPEKVGGGGALLLSYTPAGVTGSNEWTNEWRDRADCWNKINRTHLCLFLQPLESVLRLSHDVRWSCRWVVVRKLRHVSVPGGRSEV